MIADDLGHLRNGGEGTAGSLPDHFSEIKDLGTGDHNVQDILARMDFQAQINRMVERSRDLS